MNVDDYKYAIIESKEDFLKRSKEDIESFLRKKGVYLVKGYINDEKIDNFKNDMIMFANTTLPEWKPFTDESSSYHRYNNEDERSYVKGRLHQFSINLWRKGHTEDVGRTFIHDIAKFKMRFIEKDDFQLDRKPSSGYAYRITINHYPIGGGYLSYHTDPVSKTNPMLTILQASKYNRDFRGGGLYISPTSPMEKYYVEPFFEKGDMVVMDPSIIIHGVEPIDDSSDLEWDMKKGRMVIALAGGYADSNKEKKVSIQVD